MKQIVLGTAGHIDHGKTSLVKTISGIDTDRLKEEKLRGITIELGFASMDLPSGQHLGIVDVPGHEKFVKNMVAGATGIDMVVMVIAADEGVMPQTREHMEICTLLGIQHGFVVLTKTDLVDEEWLELVTDDVAGFVRGTFMEDAPIVPVSSVTGRGIQEFINTLDNLSAGIPARSSSGLFRLPVDRIFSMKGFGTVITGTLISGQVRVGDTIMIYPSCITSKVRGIQVHNRSVDSAEAGLRTAINFQGLEKASIKRGEVVSSPDVLKPSYMIDVSFHFLARNKKPVKNRVRIRFHTGTSEVLGVLILLDKDELSPGETAIAQIRLESPLAVVKDDRFVVRSYSPMRTIGGGHILNPIPRKHKRFKPELVKGLKSIAGNIPKEVIYYHVKAAAYQGVSYADLKIMTNMPDKMLNSTLAGLLSKKTVIQTDKEKRIFIHGNNFEKLQKEALNYLGDYHRAHPLKAGISKEELKSKFLFATGSKLFKLMLDQMIVAKTIVAEENIVRLTGHAISLEVDQADVRERILHSYRKTQLQPPYFKELSKTLAIDPRRAKDVLLLLVDEGLLVKTKDDLYFHTEAVNDLQRRLVDFIEAHGEITTPQFKEMTGASRKYVIPLLEYFDSQNVTIRIGDIRKLRKG